MFLSNAPGDLSAHYPAGYVTPPRSMAVLQRIANDTRYQMDLVLRYVAGGTLLEIGPGYGSFLWLAKSAGFQVKAIESDASACEYLRHTVGADVVMSAAPQEVLAGLHEQYDAVVLWHSLEHLPAPWETLRRASQLLNPRGILVIATPNPAAWQFRRLGGSWPHVDAPRHLWLIPYGTLRDYLRPLGLVAAFATTGDRGGRRWDRFGWSQTLLNVHPRALRHSLLARAMTRMLGWLVATAVSPWERANMRGSAYTAVFQKQDG